MTTQGEARVRRVAVAGASGYTGVELLRFLVQHPAVRLVALTAETHAGQPISQVFPNLKGFVDLTCRPLDAAALAAEAGVRLSGAAAQGLDDGRRGPGETRAFGSWI